MIRAEVGGGVWSPLCSQVKKLDPGGVLGTSGSTHKAATTVGDSNIDQSSLSSNSSWFQLISGRLTKFNASPCVGL